MVLLYGKIMDIGSNVSTANIQNGGARVIDERKKIISIINIVLFTSNEFSPDFVVKELEFGLFRRWFLISCVTSAH